MRAECRMRDRERAAMLMMIPFLEDGAAQRRRNTPVGARSRRQIADSSDNSSDADSRKKQKRSLPQQLTAAALRLRGH
eukprot:6214656-Pleurochrysis_carterae.AAC.3